MSEMETMPVQIKTPPQICLKVSFYSYFKDLTDCVDTTEIVAEGETLGDLFEQLIRRFPRLGPMRNSTLIAVGLDYEDRNYVLKNKDEVSLFPPVQGG